MNFKNIFSRPFFTVIFRPEMLKFYLYSILTGQTMVGFVIYILYVIFFIFFSNFRYKSLTKSQCDAIETDYQRYLREKSIGKLTSDRRKIATDSKTIEIDYFESKMSAPHQGSIKRQFQKGLWFRIANSPKKREFHVKINRIQIDNQMVCYRIFPRNMYNN